MRFLFLIYLSLFLFPIKLVAIELNEIEISLTNDKRCFFSNGIPNHKTGIFPNKGNPNSISKQKIHVCVPRYPKKASARTKIKGIIGIALNGVFFRPATSGFWDPKARCGWTKKNSI